MGKIGKAGIAFGALLAAAALAGCKPGKSEDKDWSFLNHPPPTPPNCPDSAELKNITLKDGTIADVRIVDFRTVKLYIPKDMILEYVDHDISSFDIDQKLPGQKSHYFISPHKPRLLNQYYPDIYSNECPGVVHRIIMDSKYPFNPIILNMVGGGVEHSAKNIESSENEQVALLPKMTPSPAEIDVLLGFFKVHILWRDQIWILTAVQNDSMGAWNDNRSLKDLVSWLATPPSRRDNDRRFTIKVDSK